MNEIIDRLIDAALIAVDPFNAIQQHVRVDGDNLIIADRIIDLRDREIICVCLGKGSVPMARALDLRLGDRIDRGLIVTKSSDLNASQDRYLADFKFPLKWEAIESAHPIPDENSLFAGDRVWDILDNCTDRTLVLAGISGGASSLVVAPRNWQALISLLTNPLIPEITEEIQQLLQTSLVKNSIDLHCCHPEEQISLSALQAIGSALLSSGLPIQKINAVRSRIDRLKGGGLVDRVDAGEVIGLILSDVIGDPISAIASGLTDRPAANNILVGNNLQACESIAKTARELGFNPQIVTTELDGEAKVRGMEIAREIITHPAKTMLIYGGETIVNLPMNCTGKGGRNQELGLAAAIELSRSKIPAWVITLATDGTDGPTNALGAKVNETTIARALALNLDANSALDRHDSYPFFDLLGDLHPARVTGTNVADITIALRV